MEEIRRLGSLRRAAQYIAASLSTVRRAIISDNHRLGRDNPSALGRLVDMARAEYVKAQKAQREQARVARLKREEIKDIERRIARAKVAAAARWRR